MPAVNVIQVPNRAYPGVGYGPNVQTQPGYAPVHQLYTHQPVGYSGPSAYTSNLSGAPAYGNPPGPLAYNNTSYNAVQDSQTPTK